MENLADYYPHIYMGIAPIIIASLIAAASMFGQGMLNRSQSKQNQAYAREMADYQYSKDLEMWQRQNAYNAPAQQMQRWTDAGLNPNLVFSQGNPGNAGTMPKYQDLTGSADYVKPMQIAGVLSAYQDLALKQAQIDNVKSLNDLNQKKSLGQSFENMLKSTEYDKAQYLLGTKILDENSPYRKKYEAQVQNLTLKNLYAGETYQQNIKRLELRNLYQEQLNNLAKQGIFPGDESWMRIGIQALDKLDAANMQQGLSEPIWKYWPKWSDVFKR